MLAGIRTSFPLGGFQFWSVHSLVCALEISLGSFCFDSSAGNYRIPTTLMPDACPLLESAFRRWLDTGLHLD